jgi:hypothetical protein
MHIGIGIGFGRDHGKSCKDAPKSRHEHHHNDDKDSRPVSWHHKHSSHHDWDKKSSSHCG